jgi:hypothetical protein
MSNQQQVGMMKGMERAFDVVKEITKSPTGILGSELKKLQELHDCGFIEDEVLNAKK